MNKDAGEHVISTGDVLVFTIEFSENVYLDDNDAQFSLYIDIISGVLTGEEGSFSKRTSNQNEIKALYSCLLYTSPSPRDRTRSRMPSSA